MKELIVATRNTKKLAEIKDLLKDVDLKITSLLDYDDLPFIEEDGTTFSQNAIKKAVTIAMYTGKLTMGEDSGLEVRALGNRPGVYSARYSGEDATDKENNVKLLKELAGLPSRRKKAGRQARYRCFVALADGEKLIDIVSGSCRGVISLKEKGTNGFGYDPLFLIAKYGKTFAELDPQIKAGMSHRSRALKKFRGIIQKYFLTRR